MAPGAKPPANLMFFVVVLIGILAFLSLYNAYREMFPPLDQLPANWLDR